MVLQYMSTYQYFEVCITDVVADADADANADAATFHVHRFCFYNDRLILVCYWS